MSDRVPTPIRVLVVEDNPDDAVLTIRALEVAGFAASWERVETAAALRAALSDGRWDVCLSDYNLPSFEAPEALEIVRLASPRLPFIVMSATAGEDEAVAIMRAGADDYLLKGHLTRLGEAVRHAIANAAALKRSESMVEAILRGINDGVVTTTADGTIAYFSVGAERIFGYPAAEVIGTPVGRLIPERLRETHREQERRFVEPGGSARRIEHPAVLVGLRKNGEEFPIESVISRIEAATDVLATVVIRDITERRRAEDELARTVEQLRLLESALTNAVDAVVITDATRGDPIVQYVNPAFTRLSGYTAAEAVGRSIRETHAMTFDAARAARVMEAATRGETFVSEGEVRRKDGAGYTVEMRLAPIPDAEGRTAHFVGILRDITERKEAERRLRGLAHRLSLMFANVPVALYTHAVEEGRRFRFRSVNPAYLTATGLTEDAVVGRLVDEVIAEPSLSLVLGKYREAVRTRETVRWVETTPYPTGTKVAAVTITPIFDDAGRCTELFGTVYDLTEIRQITEELRTSEEQKGLLEVLNRRLAEATMAKSAFLANMSHELRTPLNAILGFSQLLEERVGASLEERQRGWLRNIQAAGTHLLDLINDVLDLSKVEAGRYEIRPEQITLADLLAPVLSTARPDAEARGLLFDATAAPATTVFLDPLRTRQILLNLLSNAVKFTERGHVWFAAGVAGRDLQFVVSDTGIGIPAAAQHRVFGVFERLHEGRHAAAGTGLGLALSKRLVELQGGSISFTSEEGVGTTFRVSLPGAVHEDMTGPRVLIVEDDPRDAALIAALVAEVGLAVEIAVTGATALAAIRRGPPTAIVLDLRLPDMRGEVVLEAVQSDSATPHIPVVVVTVEDDEGRTRPLGAADHLTKPIDAARLRRWLELVTNGQRGGG